LGILFAGKIPNPRDLKGILEMAQNEFGLRIKKFKKQFKEITPSTPFLVISTRG
jgi:hypothetical protein